jgi:hypothetical protein
MAKKEIAEDTAAAFKSNVTGKVNTGDKPKKLDGEIDVINKKPHLNYDDQLPDYTAATTKDTSKSATVTKKVGAGEQRGTMGNMPMVDKLKGDASTSLKEDEEPGDDDVELTEEEVAEYMAHRTAVMEDIAARLDEYIPSDENPVDMNEHVAVLFEGSDLSEEFKAKATTLFTSAVHSEVGNVLGAILEAATDLVIENDMALTESYDEKISNGLTAIAETWAEANAVGIQSRLKTEITEDFLHGFIKLLNDHNINLPEEKVEVVEAMADKVLELEAQVNEALEENIRLRTALDEEIKSKVVDKLAEGLADTQIAKFRNLCEGIDSSENFEQKAAQLKESYFGTKGKSKIGNPLAGEEKVLTESEVNLEAKTVTESAEPAKVVSPISRFAPRR